MSHDLWAIYGHIAYFLIFLSFLVRKIIWLRSLSICAGIFSIAYNYSIAATPLWTPIQWNIIFMATNIYHLYSLYKEKQDIKFYGYEKNLYEEVFCDFTPYQFQKLLDISQVNGCYKDQRIIEQNKHIEELYLIINSSLKIIVNNQHITNLNAGDFVGEMSFMTGEPTRASAFALDDEVRVLSWNTDQLKKLLSNNSEINGLFTAALGKQLINQLMDKSLHQHMYQELKLVS